MDLPPELPTEETFLDRKVRESKTEAITRAFEWCEKEPVHKDSRSQLRYNLCIFASIVETYFDDLVLQTKRKASYKAIKTRVQNLLSKPSKIKNIPWGLKKVDNKLEFINDDYSKLFELVCKYKVLKGMNNQRLYDVIYNLAGEYLDYTFPPNENGENTSGEEKWKRNGDLDRIIKKYKVGQ